MARLTGLEPATPGVTGRYSNQLSYNRAAAVAVVLGFAPARVKRVLLGFRVSGWKCRLGVVQRAA